MAPHKSIDYAGVGQSGGPIPMRRKLHLRQAL